MTSSMPPEQQPGEDVSLAELRAPWTPTEAQWGGLARDIMMWLDFGDKTPRRLFRHLEGVGREIPDWLRNEPELQALAHVPSKGTRCTIIYRAMLAALPQFSTPQVGEDVREKIAREMLERIEKGAAAVLELQAAMDEHYKVIREHLGAERGPGFAHRINSMLLRVSGQFFKLREAVGGILAAQPSTAQPSEDDAALIERLRAKWPLTNKRRFGFVNPDGPEAADRIEALSNLKSSAAKDPGNG